MSLRVVYFVLVAALTLFAAPRSAASGKPPQLPVRTNVDCAPTPQIAQNGHDANNAVPLPVEQLPAPTPIGVEVLEWSPQPLRMPIGHLPTTNPNARHVNYPTHHPVYPPHIVPVSSSAIGNAPQNWPAFCPAEPVGREVNVFFPHPCGAAPGPVPFSEHPFVCPSWYKPLPLHPIQPVCRTTEIVHPFPPFAPVVHQSNNRTAIRQLYQSADRFRTQGDWKRAHHMYEEIHLRSPNCRYGQMAARRLTEIENRTRPQPRPAQRSVGAPQWRPRSMPIAVHSTPRPMPAKQMRVMRLDEALQKFHEAEQQRRTGCFERAYRMYQEVIRIQPDSGCALRARMWIRHFDSLRHSTVPQEQTSSTRTSRNAQPCCGVALGSVLGGAAGAIACEAESCNKWCQCCETAREFANLFAEGFATGVELVDAENGNNNAKAKALFAAMNSVLGLPNVEIEIDAQADGSTRYFGGVHIGMLGCQIICEGNQCSIVGSFMRQRP